jgi:hypothetical protein
MVDPYMIVLAGITLLAAIVNGALGYGFSSITVPVALLFLVNRILNPALVLIEVVLNAYVLWNNRDALPRYGHRGAGKPCVAAFLDLRRAASVDLAAGRGSSPTDQV